MRTHTITSLLLLFCVVAYGQENDCSLNEVFRVAETPPVFGDCDQLVMTKSNSYQCSDENVQAYVRGQLRLRNIQLTEANKPVTVELILNKSGDVCKTSLPMQSGVENAKVIAEILANMPQWTPAKQGGKEVNIRIQVSYSG